MWTAIERRANDTVKASFYAWGQACRHPAAGDSKEIVLNQVVFSSATGDLKACLDDSNIRIFECEHTCHELDKSPGGRRMLHRRLLRSQPILTLEVYLSHS